MISLCYILIYLLHKGNLLDIDVHSDKDGLKCLEIAKKAKREQNMAKLCYGTSQCLQGFVSEIFALKFEQEPDYNKLRQMLSEALNQPSNSNFDCLGKIDEMIENVSEKNSVKESIVQQHNNSFK